MAEVRQQPLRVPTLTPWASQNNNELRERLRWVIGLRWSVVLALFAVVILGNTYRGDTLQTSLVHFALAIAVLLYNLFYLQASRRPGFGESELTNRLRYAQVPIDLAVFTVLVHFSGGATSPVFVLYFLYIFVGLAILPPSGAYWVAAIAALFYGLLSAVECFWLKPPVGRFLGTQATPPTDWKVYLGYFLVVSATLLITAYIANYFARLLTRDESTIREQLDDMNTLYTVTRKLSTTLNTDVVMRTLLSITNDIAHPGACWLFLFNDQGEGFVGATSGVSAEERNALLERRLTANHPVLKQMLVERKEIYAPIVDSAADYRTLLARDSRSFYALPMINEERLIGTLNLSYDRPHTVSISQWHLLGTLTQQAALAMERSHLFTDAERAAREMTGLYHIGLATTSSLQIDEVLQLIYEQVQRVVHPDTFYIGLCNDDLTEIGFDIFVENGAFLPPFKARLGDGISAWVARNRRPVFVRNWDTEIEQLPFEAGVVGSPTQSLISVPLMAKNKMVGVMSVQSLRANAFDKDHLRLLTSIAGQAALSLENAKLHAQVHEQAQRDPLTGVYNHGVFIDKLHSALRQAKQEKLNVALVMLDIDRFKQYNDTYGHMVGDDVLRSIVVAIQNHLKSTDIVGRWGGEEFGIILPDVSRTQVRLIAERIRTTAAHTVMSDIHGRSIPSPTVSQGLALYPSDALEIEELIDKADSALYRAKESGRNQIAEWIDMAGERSPISFRARG